MRAWGKVSRRLCAIFTIFSILSALVFCIIYKSTNNIQSHLTVIEESNHHDVDSKQYFTSGSSSLIYYNAESEQNIILEWYTMVKTPLDEATSMEKLENEAKNKTGKPDTKMYVYLESSKESNKSVSGLTRAECIVVMMYTGDFYTEYNGASRNRSWYPYRVYTTLLVSALLKLAKIDPIPPNTTLYRGINFISEPPRARRIFWKTFTSTSLDIKVAEDFATSAGTILEFQPPVSRKGAKIRNLSSFGRENEILLLPFEAFNFRYANGSRFYFNTSETPKIN